MFYLILGAIVLYLFWCNPALNRKIFLDGGYISPERTTMLNGIFIFLVFMSHAKAYTTGNYSVWNVNFIRLIIANIGQFMVAGFFFFSGYGIMESLRRKGNDYMKGFIRTRFLKVLLTFDIAVGIYILVQYSLGVTYTTERYLLSLVGWYSVGNSSWFICNTLCLYLVFYLSYICSRGNRTLHIILMLLFNLGLYIFMVEMRSKADHYCYDTLWVFPAGCIYAMVRSRVEKAIAFTRIPPTLIGIALIYGTMAIAQYPYVKANWELYNVRAILFALGLLYTFSEIEFRKKPTLLLASGGALFSIYIFQRLPMLWLVRTRQIKTDDDVFYLFTLLATIIIACISTRIFNLIGKYLFSKKTAK